MADVGRRVDVATQLATGGEVTSDIDLLRHKGPVLGRVTSPATVRRTLDDPGTLRFELVNLAGRDAGRPPRTAHPGAHDLV